MGERARAFDWTSTPLGPAPEWPDSLKTAVSILLGAPQPLVIWWGAELIQLYNDPFQTLLGERQPEVFGRPAAEAWSEARPTLETAVKAAQAGHTSTRMTTSLRVNRSGQVEDISLTFSLVPVRDAQGHIGGFLCACEDVAHGLHGEQATHAEGSGHQQKLAELDRASLRRMLNVRGVGVLLFEQATGILLDANDFFFQMFGYDRADVAARLVNWRTMTPDEHVAISEAQMEKLVVTGTIGPYEKEYLRKDGSRSWMVFAGASLGNGTVAEYCIDISDRKRAEAALRASQDALQASEERLQLASQAKDDFLGTLGHELRTPLAAITLWARVIRSGAVPSSELSRALDVIIESAATQARLVDDLLDLSRLATGKLMLTPVDVVIEDVARSAGELLRPAAEVKNVTLQITIAPGLGRAFIDVARLRQVLWNLLSNALKFTAPGGTVTLTLGKSSDALEIEVRDTGDGITPEFMPRLFERFSQADMSGTTGHGGLGIGLALCRHLVELQGGTIEAHSEGPGRGSSFSVRLPWVEAKLGAAAVSLAVPAGDPQRALSGVTVLLVDDDEYMLTGMRVTLERAGARVIPLHSALAALSTFEALEPSATPIVLVSDIVLPTISGYDLVERVAAVQRARGLSPIPACAVSGHAREADQERALAAGFDMYLVKPVTPERLVEAVVDLTHVARDSVA